MVEICSLNSRIWLFLCIFVILCSLINARPKKWKYTNQNETEGTPAEFPVNSSLDENLSMSKQKQTLQNSQLNQQSEKVLSRPLSFSYGVKTKDLVSGATAVEYYSNDQQPPSVADQKVTLYRKDQNRRQKTSQNISRLSGFDHGKYEDEKHPTKLENKRHTDINIREQFPKNTETKPIIEANTKKEYDYLQLRKPNRKMLFKPYAINSQKPQQNQKLTIPHINDDETLEINVPSLDDTSISNLNNLEKSYKDVTFQPHQDQPVSLYENTSPASYTENSQLYREDSRTYDSSEDGSPLIPQNPKQELSHLDEKVQVQTDGNGEKQNFESYPIGYEKGGGQEHQQSNKEMFKEKTGDTYEKQNEFKKENLGLHVEEEHKANIDEKGGTISKLTHNNGHSNYHTQGVEAVKEGELKEDEEANKGHSTKGGHDVIKKDEYDKKIEFYDEFYEENDDADHGEFHMEKEFDKGEHKKEEHKEQGQKNSLNSKDHKVEHKTKDKKQKGYSEDDSSNQHHHHSSNDGKSEEEEGKKPWEFGKIAGEGRGNDDERYVIQEEEPANDKSAEYLDNIEESYMRNNEDLPQIIKKNDALRPEQPTSLEFQNEFEDSHENIKVCVENEPFTQEKTLKSRNLDLGDHTENYEVTEKNNPGAGGGFPPGGKGVVPFPNFKPSTEMPNPKGEKPKDPNNKGMGGKDDKNGMDGEDKSIDDDIRDPDYDFDYTYLKCKPHPSKPKGNSEDENENITLHQSDNESKLIVTEN